MNRRIIVIAMSAMGLFVFLVGAYFYTRSAPVEATGPQFSESVFTESVLERSYSPSFGPSDARVTVVEFFDPSCEACRAFHPTVKRILAKYPEDVRVVLRYTPFHDGSEEVVRLLETARMQGVYEPVLEAVLAAQPQWAKHGAPQLEIAFQAAATAGLDIEKSRRFLNLPDITSILSQDKADVKAVGVRGTPTFFVNGKPLPEFGQQQLLDFVEVEVAAMRASARR